MVNNKTGHQFSFSKYKHCFKKNLTCSGSYILKLIFLAKK